MKSKEEITLDEQKQLSVSILRDLDAFCRERGLNYSLAYGSLIGAVRHKGFIPWDDDLDVMMPRKDYDILVAEWLPHHNYYRMNEFSVNKDYELPFAKIDDTRTIRVELGRSDLGVNIDVFPIDNITDDDKEFHRIASRQKKLRYMLAVKKLRWKHERSLIGNIIIATAKVVLKPFPASFFVSRLINNATLYNSLPTKHCGCMSAFSYSERERMNAAVFTQYTQMTFEDGSYSVIADYDTFLRGIYHDYMKLPPEDKRKPIHNLKCYWR